MGSPPGDIEEPDVSESLLSRYGEPAKERFADRSADLLMEFHLGVQGAARQRSGGRHDPLAREIEIVDVERAYTAITRQPLHGQFQLGVALAILGLGVGSLFTMYAVPVEGRPGWGVPAGWALVAAGLVPLGMAAQSYWASRRKRN